MKNKRLKKEFAKVLGFTKKKKPYYNDPDMTYREDLSWEEIFCEIGRLKAIASMTRETRPIPMNCDEI